MALIDKSELARQVPELAELAKLELTPEEAALFTTQLGDILKYVESLQAVDVSGIEPLVHPLDLQETPFREDQVENFARDAEGRPRVLESAPDVLHDGFKVPPIL